MSMLEFDDEAARRIQRTYATPDVVQQRAEVLALVAARPGERVLDVGSGPGYLVASLAEAVAARARPRGLARSGRWTTLAGLLREGRRWVRIEDGAVLGLPYPDGAFDAA